MNDQKKLILVVEDELAQREILNYRLKKEGYDVISVKDGEDGLKIALEKHPDLILLDIIMPKKNGLDMVNELRRDAWGKTAKVIILTNLSTPKDVQKALDEEVYEYLVKSDTKIETVVSKIEEFLCK
jgi:DNA-binding response OmpR family regulator